MNENLIYSKIRNEEDYLSELISEKFVLNSCLNYNYDEGIAERIIEIDLLINNIKNIVTYPIWDGKIDLLQIKKPT